MLHSRSIRKIIFGQNPLTGGLVFVVGNTFVQNKERYRIVSAEEDAQFFNEYGEIRYNVYIKKLGRVEEEVVWKSAIGVPVTIEYFLPGEQDVITVT